MIKRIINLPAGGELEIEYEDEFLLKVREGLNLNSVDEITDSHIREFIYRAGMTAVEKAEKEMAEEEESQWGCCQWEGEEGRCCDWRQG